MAIPCVTALCLQGYPRAATPVLRKSLPWEPGLRSCTMGGETTGSPYLTLLLCRCLNGMADTIAPLVDHEARMRKGLDAPR